VVALVGCKAKSIEEKFLAGELTESDYEKVTMLELGGNKLTSIPNGLEKLTQLTYLNLVGNQLTDVKGLENLTQLTVLALGGNKLTDLTGLEKLPQLEFLGIGDNPALTKAQIAELQKALPKCLIHSNPKK
jgi:internalin A